MTNGLAIAIVGVVLLVGAWLGVRGQIAHASLYRARRGLDPIEADRWAGDRPYLSAELVDAVARERLASCGVQVDYGGHELAQLGPLQLARVRFSWAAWGWRSPPTTIEVLLDRELPTSAQAIAACTTARKLYLRSLLGIRQSADPETQLARANDQAALSMRAATERLLKAVQRRDRREASVLIRMAVPSRSAQVEPPTLEQLTRMEVAALCWWLLVRLDGEKTFNPGETPPGFGDDDIPF